MMNNLKKIIKTTLTAMMVVTTPLVIIGGCHNDNDNNNPPNLPPAHNWLEVHHWSFNNQHDLNDFINNTELYEDCYARDFKPWNGYPLFQKSLVVIENPYIHFNTLQKWYCFNYYIVGSGPSGEDQYVMELFSQ